MNGESSSSERSILPALIGIVGALLIVLVLVWAMKRYTEPAPLNQNRAAERAKALAELRGVEHTEQTTAGWIDQPKGIVRLPIEDAIAIVEREWRNPPAARSNLLARVAKANPPPPPKPPSQFE
jgi:hypothetical protein